jgi:hypothetical protein
VSIFIQGDIGPFSVFDIPLHPLRLTLEDERGEELSLDDVLHIDPDLIDPLGARFDGTLLEDDDPETLQYQGLAATKEGDQIVIAFPSDITLIPTPGVWSLALKLNRKQEVEPQPFIVQRIDGWYGISQLRREWRDAPSDDFLLYQLLEVAKKQVMAFAPALKTPGVPVNYRLAQKMQARNLWNSAITDPSGAVGDDGFAIRPFPMDWTVKNVLRPKRGKPVVA